MPGVFFPQCRAVLQVVFDGFAASDSKPTVIHVSPLSANVHMNGYRQADTFDMEFDCQAFPFSPELIRSAAVEIYLFQTPGIVSNPELYVTSDNLAITGLVDDCALRAGSDGLVFQCSGRDYTALMLDKAWPVGKRVPVGEDLDTAVQKLVDECTQAAKVGRTLTVKYIGEGDVPQSGKLAKTTTSDHVTIKPKTGLNHGRTNKKGIPVRSGKNYWDVIYSMCLQHGQIVYVRGTDVIISKPQTLTGITQAEIDNIAASLPLGGFIGQNLTQLKAAQESKIIHTAWGRDLATLEVSRHMGREQVPQIIATSYDADTQTVLEAKWPENPKGEISPEFKAKGAGAAQITGAGIEKEATRRITVPGVKDLAQLREVAKTYYHTLGRAEAKVKIATKDLQDLRGKDMLGARPGNALLIDFDAVHIEEIRQLSGSQREARLRSLGYSPQVASLIADEYDKINQFRQPVYCKDISFAFSRDSGIAIDIEGVNFVSVARDDKR